jgi:hypothetical protein
MVFCTGFAPVPEHSYPSYCMRRNSTRRPGTPLKIGRSGAFGNGTTCLATSFEPSEHFG